MDIRPAKKFTESIITLPNFNESYIFAKAGFGTFSLSGSKVRSQIAKFNESGSWPLEIKVKNLAIGRAINYLGTTSIRDAYSNPSSILHEAFVEIDKTLIDYIYEATDPKWLDVNGNPKNQN